MRIWKSPVLLVLSWLLSFSNPLADVVSDFSAGTEYWTITADHAGTWDPVVGNPPGSLAIHDLATGQINMASAPKKFLGDWLSLSNGSDDTVAFDVYFDNTSGGPLYTGPGII